MEHSLRPLLINFVNVIFSLCLFFNAILFIPQALRIMREKNAKGVSLFTFIGFNIIQIFTILHGYFAKDYILVIGYMLGFVTCGMVTYLALKYRNT